MSRIPKLVLVTDRTATRDCDLVAVVETALAAGLPAVQLREKDLPGRPLLALAERLRAATTRTGALLFINDRVDVAIACGADGVHLGAASMAVDAARRLLGDRALIGVSTHAPGEAAAGADFAFFGPVWETPSKSGAQGAARLAAAIRAAKIPVLAIGGVTPARVADVRAAGAAGVAVIRAILAADDPGAATRALVEGVATIPSAD
ncbi:MAG TPA: thiamine phosphate synthase [Candidatus Binatia bacterium]|nr:thiamine phosphate synthase [Candidatus Binatia bacterium]